ncbi:MAG: hypothetical protein IAF38_00195, partial [Bacteroidia bacterium]|nr:hypothetical protein [Bacteroidia bacterium]
MSMNGNKTDPTPISFSLKEIFETVKDLLAPYAIKKKLLFSCETDELTAKVRAEGDPFMLSHILMCLLSNAIKFTIKGSIEVKVTHKRSDAENIELQFSVTDTGTGISETDVEKAINAFATEENGTRTAKNTSAGFGLSLCKRMVKTLGG